jgi:hypothetical protein
MTALLRIKHSFGHAFGALLLAIGLTLLALCGLAAVAVPAALGILAIEWARARRGLGAAKWLSRTTKPVSPRRDAATVRANQENK